MRDRLQEIIPTHYRMESSKGYVTSLTMNKKNEKRKSERVTICKQIYEASSKPSQFFFYFYLCTYIVVFK